MHYTLLTEKAAWFALVAAAFSAAAVLVGMAAQDVLRLYPQSSVTEFYRIYVDEGGGLSQEELMANTFFPLDQADGAPRVNFPLPSSTQSFQIALGEHRDRVVRLASLCIERSLFVTRCLSGADAARFVESASEASFEPNGNSLDVTSFGNRPSLTFDQRLLDVLRPAWDLRLFLVRAGFYAAATAFFFCFFLALFRAVSAWGTRDSLLVFAIAGCIRAVFFALAGTGTVSDSDLFLRYFQFHLFGNPGIRGIIYPAFLALFSANRGAAFAVQFLLGAAGSAIVLILIRSLKPASRWDLVLALLATSLPALLAMEALILSESLSLFLLLSVMLAFRWVQFHATSAGAIAGLGVSCALLAQAKPQFGFVAVLFAAVLVIPRLWPDTSRADAIRRLACFGTPVAALYMFALSLTFSYGNFRGTSSTLGYSLFDHAQQSIVCPNAETDPHIIYYCQAREAIGPGADPSAYTAWVIFPAMHNLHKPFYQVTNDYAQLSFRLIMTHPGLYARNVLNSFVMFWTGEIPMVRSLLLSQKRITWALWADRLLRDGIVFAFFAAAIAAVVRRVPPDRDAYLFCAVAVIIVLASSILQALLESGRENPRFEIPTEPLLMVVIVTIAAKIKRPGWSR